MKKKKVLNENYLENKPIRSANMKWTINDKFMVVLEVENKGIFNKIAQMLFKKPKISFIHLDELGSFVWNLCDGEKSIIEIGEKVEKEFAEQANPLYERLATYFQMLNEYGFVTFKKD